MNQSSGSAVSVEGAALASTASYVNANEQQWRELLRAFQQQSARSVASAVSSAGASAAVATSSSSLSSVSSSSSSLNYVPAAISSAGATPPPATPPVAIKKKVAKKRLPQSGPMADALVLLCAAGFMTAVHRKTATRRLAEVVA